MVVLFCMCEYICVSVTAMYKCICVSVHLSVYESGLPCTNVQILMFWMGVENTHRLGSVPEMDVRITCITDHHIRSDKLSHGVAHLTCSIGGWRSWKEDV